MTSPQSLTIQGQFYLRLFARLNFIYPILASCETLYSNTSPNSCPTMQKCHGLCSYTTSVFIQISNVVHAFFRYYSQHRMVDLMSKVMIGWSGLHVLLLRQIQAISWANFPLDVSFVIFFSTLDLPFYPFSMLINLLAHTLWVTIY